MVFGILFSAGAFLYFMFFRSRFGESFVTWTWRHSPWRLLRSKEKRDQVPRFATARFYVWMTGVMMLLGAVIFLLGLVKAIYRSRAVAGSSCRPDDTKGCRTWDASVRTVRAA